MEGAKGLPALMAKVQAGGPGVLFHGALAASVATFVGHYPWFAVVREHCALPDFIALNTVVLVLAGTTLAECL